MQPIPSWEGVGVGSRWGGVGSTTLTGLSHWRILDHRWQILDRRAEIDFSTLLSIAIKNK